MRVHFIGERDDGVSVSSHHARALAELGVRVSFDAGERDPDANAASQSEARWADVIHLVTVEPALPVLLRRLALWRLAGKGIVRYWSGRDVLWAKHHAPSRAFAHAVSRLGALQVARTPLLAGELSRLGIPAQPGPLLSLHIASTCSPTPLPATFTALCYLPTERRDFCGGKWIDDLIRRLPQVRFLILGDESTDYSASRNVESLGVTDDVPRTIKRCTVVLQPRMDGVLSRLSMEALSHGRHVIATHAGPHCHYAASLDAFCSAIRALEGEVDFNLAGREYACREFGKPLAARQLLEVLQHSAEPLDGARRPGRWRAVLTALGGGRSVHTATCGLPDPSSLPPEAAPFAALLAASRKQRHGEPEPVNP